mmetsp:Transcript_30974/g.68640  ORF Transcript_30974/g.68640 Transcript_30974/m.68640 type:complete len:133 (-) Transcript_30974:3490-3888(-)
MLPMHARCCAVSYTWPSFMQFSYNPISHTVLRGHDRRSMHCSITTGTLHTAAAHNRACEQQDVYRSTVNSTAVQPLMDLHACKYTLLVAKPWSLASAQYMVNPPPQKRGGWACLNPGYTQRTSAPAGYIASM